MKKNSKIIKLPRKKKSIKKRKPKDYSGYRCNLSYVHKKKCLDDDYSIELNVCEAHQSISCNGTYEEFKNCKLKEFIKSREKEIKVFKDFLKIKKLKKQNGDEI